MKHTTTQFDFAAKPRVTGVKPKYREERLDGTNLMNDPRVVRGNTYAAIVENKNDIQPPPRKQAEAKPRKRERVLLLLLSSASTSILALNWPLQEQLMAATTSQCRLSPS